MDNPKPTSPATLFDIIAVRNANQGALATISKYKNNESRIDILMRKTSARIKLILHRYFFSSSKYTRNYFSYQDFYEKSKHFQTKSRLSKVIVIHGSTTPGEMRESSSSEYPNKRN